MTLSRRSLFRTAAVAGGVLVLGEAGTASAADFGSASWNTVVPGVPVNGLAFRLGTGEDDLRGPEGLSPASAITATVVLENSAGRSTIVQQLNGADEGWPKWTVHDKWLSFARSTLRPVLAENVRSVHLHWTPGQGGWFADNWDMTDLTIFHPRGDGLGDPPFTDTVPDGQFNPMFAASGRPWHHRFRENLDSEGGPDYEKTNPHWNPVVSQRNWRWCNRCQGMFFGGWTGRCPLGGGHNPTGSGNYTMFVNNGVHISKQPGWRSCAKCSGLYFAGNPTPGICPAGGGHDATHSWQYLMAFTALG